MLKVLHAFFNSRKNPCLTYPMLLVLDSTMFSPSVVRVGGCSSLDFDVQDFPLLVSNLISSPSPVGMPDPIIPFSFTTLNPSVLSFSLIAIRL
jgi:hypothetical protein